MKFNPLHFADFYKTAHQAQYPKGTEYVYSNFTPRRAMKPHLGGGIIFFGLQYYLKEYLIKGWNENFFNKPKEEVVAAFKRRMELAMGNDCMDYSHIEELHELGYLPLNIKSLPEGTYVPVGVPVLTIINTDPRFYWLTNFIETSLCNTLWKPCTSATTAFRFRKRFEKFAEITGADKSLIPYQVHDFSMRGLSSFEDACTTGAAHLTSFLGTDSIHALDFVEEYYPDSHKMELEFIREQKNNYQKRQNYEMAAAMRDKEKEVLKRIESEKTETRILGASVPATEHSVMCAHGKNNEFETYRYLIEEVYPTGTVSLVFDTWDYWRAVTDFLPNNKDLIMNRDGKVVIRPDSGNPIDIICGTHELVNGEVPTNAQRKGTLQLLWETFGGTINEKGYKVLDPHIGLIYGDSIDLSAQLAILSKMQSMGFASSNIVFGIGSDAYNHVKRDFYGWATKATWVQINGEGKEIFKDPKTSSGTKKSAKGLLKVYRENGILKLQEQCTKEEEKESLLQTVFYDSDLIRQQPFSDIREIVLEQEPINDTL